MIFMSAIALGEIFISNQVLVRSKQTEDKQTTSTIPAVIWKSSVDACYIAASATLGIQATGISAEDSLNGLADMLESLFQDHHYDYAYLCARLPADFATKQAYAENMYCFETIYTARVATEWPIKVFSVGANKRT